MAESSKDIVIRQGKTLSFALRWETTPIVYKAISAIANTAPVRITVPGHGVPEGWRVAVTSVKGMTEINAEPNDVRDKDYHAATVVDPSTIELNDVNAANFRAYVSGGYLQYNTPVNLTGFTARMSIKNKVGGTTLFSLTTENGGISINVADSLIKLNISAADTAGFDWKKGVYDLEMVSASGVVTALLKGQVFVETEVTV